MSAARGSASHTASECEADRVRHELRGDERWRLFAEMSDDATFYGLINAYGKLMKRTRGASHAKVQRSEKFFLSEVDEIMRRRIADVAEQRVISRR